MSNHKPVYKSLATSYLSTGFLKSQSCCIRLPPIRRVGTQGSQEDKRLMEKGKMVFSTENAVLY